jgi:hypothetical protein
LFSSLSSSSLSSLDNNLNQHGPHSTYGLLSAGFARRETIDDEAIVKCDLPHESETTALTGYHLKIWVTEMSQGSQYFRGVQKCEATSTEDAGATAFDDRKLFNETITLILADPDVGCRIELMWSSAVIVVMSVVALL